MKGARVLQTTAAVLRLAWRGVRRQRLRSLVIIAMLAAPVAAGITLDVVLSSEHPSLAVATDELAGDARALIELPTESNGVATGPLPAGAVPAADRATEEVQTDVLLYSGRGALTVPVRAVGVDLRSGVLASVADVTSGRAPAGSGQVALTAALARSLGVGPGATIGASGSTPVLRVTGVVTDRHDRGAQVLYALRVTTQRLASAVFTGSLTRQWLVTGPAPFTPAEEGRLGRRDLVAVPRNEVVAEAGGLAGAALPGSSVALDDPRLVRGLVAIMILLEVALLAGPAFAIGARRRRRELVTLSVVGAGRGHLVGVALADGAALGAIAAVAGLVGGVGIGAAIVAGQRVWSNHLPDALTVHGWALAGVAVLAVVAGLLAAVPAAWRAGRGGEATAGQATAGQATMGQATAGQATASEPAASLRRSGPGRRLLRRFPRRWSTVGVVAVGAAVALAGTDLDATRGALGPDALFAAAALGEIGLALVASDILAFAGRFADRLPLWPRLALRDASRHRGAAAPAVAAIIAVVAATTTALVAGAAVAAHDRAGYEPYSIVGDAQTVAATPAEDVAALRTLRHVLPAAAVLDLRTLATCATDVSSRRDCRIAVLNPAQLAGCPPVRTTVQTSGGGAFAFGGGFARRASPACSARLSTETASAPVFAPYAPTVVATGAVAAALVGGRAGEEARAALVAGRAVVFAPGLVGGGRLEVVVSGHPQSTVSVPAVRIDAPVPPTVAGAILPPALAGRFPLPVVASTIYVKDAARLPAGTLAVADADLTRLGLGPLEVESGFDDRLDRQLLVVAAVDLVLTVAAAVTSTALMSLDGAADLLTLEALGAAVGGRRRLTAARAGLVCLIGALFGTVAGIIPGVGVVWRLRHITTTGPGIAAYPLDLPWVRLAAVALAAPIVAVGVAALVVRSHPDLTRRDP